MNYIAIALLSFITFSCAEKGNKRIENAVTGGSSTRISADLLWGVKDKVDTLNYYNLALFYLNNSEYKKALLTLQNNVQLDTISIGGFYGFKFKKGTNPGIDENYAIFRINDYVGNIGDNMLSNQLLLSFADPNDQLFFLQSVEDKYLQLTDKGVVEAKLTANEIKGILLKYPNSNRIKFLLAKTYLSAHRLDSAIEIFDFLISEDYYALPSLRTLTQYLNANGSSLYDKYAKLFRDKFPNKCLLTELKRVQMPKSEDSLSAFCKPCLSSEFQTDSIYSKLLIAKYYLAHRKFNQIDSMYEDFDKKYTSFALDNTLLIERGLYFDMKLRSLFLQGRFNEICGFVKTKIGYNEILNIKNERDFRQYIKKLFDEYKSSENEYFDIFYTRNFKCH